MIRNNELRIGNWYLAFGVDYQQVQQITNGKVLIDFNPIKLTEDILLKCGFDYHKGHDSYTIELRDEIRLTLMNITSKDSFQTEIMTSAVCDRLTCPWMLLDINSLHQLQNLYYCLTGEELNVQL